MNKKLILISALLLILGLTSFIFGLSISLQNVQNSSQTEIISPLMVKRVIDGDTIEMASGEKVRYIGIDTPETVDPRRPIGCFGKEASDENKKLVEGKEVILEKDISEVDKYGRLLRYVYVKQDDKSLLFVNDYLVRNGFAKAVTFPPDVKFSAQFIKAEKEAREKERGLWKICN